MSASQATYDEASGQTGIHEAAEELRDQAAERARSVAEQVRGSTRAQVEQRSTELGARASDAAADLRSVAEHLRLEGREGPASLAEQAADRVSRLGEYLSGASGDRLLHDVEDVARTRPWTAVAGGLLAGVAASRLLKASSAQRYHSRSGGDAPSSRSGGDAQYSRSGGDAQWAGTTVAAVPRPGVSEPRVDTTQLGERDG